MPFVDVTDIVANEEAKEMEELLRSNPEVRETAKRIEMETEFRKKMIAARKASGLTQIQLEEKSGLKQQAISRLEKAVTNAPNISTVMTYLDSIGYKLDIVPK